MNIVVDTNVFVHSHNPHCDYFEDAQDFILRLYGSNDNLVVDSGFSNTEAHNSSKIWYEYKVHIPENSLATEIISNLLINGRIVEENTSVKGHIHRDILRFVHDRSDIVFVKVCHNSSARSLVSHDFAAFPEGSRNELREREIAHIVVCGEENFD